MEKLDEAKKWYKKLAEVDPNNKEAYYSLGSSPGRSGIRVDGSAREARHEAGRSRSDQGQEGQGRAEGEVRPGHRRGHQQPEKALQIDPEYDDAMAYVNLLIRERADLGRHAEEYKKEIQDADDWVQKALETKKIKAERVAKKGAAKAE